MNELSLLSSGEVLSREERSAQMARQALVAAGSSDVLFADYMVRQSKVTLRNQAVDLKRFAEFLQAAKSTVVEGVELMYGTGMWSAVDHEAVRGFLLHMLAEGFAHGTINRRLSTVRAYAGLAMQAGWIEPGEHTKIKTVSGYGGKQARRMDERREEAGVATRIGSKRAEHVSIDEEIAKRLKRQPDTPQGRRDRLLMCILLDHGLRVGEVALLAVKSFDRRAGKMSFYRPKVDMTQTHLLSKDTKAALSAYFNSGDVPSSPDEPIFRISNAAHKLMRPGYTERGIEYRVQYLAVQAGVVGFTPHAARHYWATRSAEAVEEGKFSLFRFQEAGGWKSLTMPRRYVEWAKVANRGMV